MAGVPNDKPPSAATSPPAPSLVELLTLSSVGQAFLTGCVGLGLIVMAVWAVWRQTQPAGVVDLDQRPSRPLRLLVDVNQADWAELTLLPEIGPKTARAIVTERTERGRFRGPADFDRRIKGIGPKTMTKLLPYVTGWEETEKN
ncbi:MAG: helix-hairpin-helix domain-containing protein [Pirellulales bacterium]|nr:helix-hairpin-helix domain-containing protein [Pirellulales bacterium]